MWGNVQFDNIMTLGNVPGSSIHPFCHVNLCCLQYYTILDTLDDPKAGMYSCEVTTTSFRSMVALADMRVIGGLIILF